MKRLAFALTVTMLLLLAASAQQPPSDNVSAPAKLKSKVTPPKAIDSPSPEHAADPGKGPTVFLVTIGADGLVHDAEMIKSSDSEKADANALAAVQKWRFRPATKDGQAVAVKINIEVDSRLH